MSMNDPICPCCEVVMVKGFIELHDKLAWVSVWICDCLKRDFETEKTDYEGTCIFMQAPEPTGMQNAINKLLDD